MSPDLNSRRAVVVCPLLPYPPVSGGVKRTLRLIEAIERAGAGPCILTADLGPPGAAEALRGRGWIVELVPEPPPTLGSRLRQHASRLPSPYLTGVASRLRALSAQGPAFVQLEHTLSAYYLDALSGVRRALSLHNIDSALMRMTARDEIPLTLAWARAINRYRAMRTVERRALPDCDSVLCVSEADAERAVALGAEVVLVPNGVDDDFFRVPADPSGSEEVLFFGQLDYPPNSRGLLRFLREGWPRVLAARPTARLRVAGDGLGGELVREATRGPGVEFLGVLPDLTPELTRARLVLAPLWQGGGTRIKVLESLAAARPVVGTPLAVEQVGFASGRHGLVGASAEELASATIELLGDPERARELGRAGRQQVEHHRWSEVTRPAEELYRNWLELAGRRP